MTKRKVIGLVGLVVLAGWMIRPAVAQDLNTILVYFLTDYRAGSLALDATNRDVILTRDGANVLALRNGTAAQAFRLANTWTSATNNEIGFMRWASNVLEIGAEDGSAGGTARTVRMGGFSAAESQTVEIQAVGAAGLVTIKTNGTEQWQANADGDFISVTDGGNSIGLTGATRPLALFLSQPAVTVGSGTGVTVNDSGSVRTVVYKVTVTFSNVTTNGTTHDLTIATLPAKTFLTHALAELVTPYVCEDTCTTATLSGLLGSSAGGNQYLLSFDVDAAAAQFGDAAAELGASLNPATVPTMIGALGSWASTSAITYRITSAVGDLATAGATNLNAGSITFYLTTVKLP